MDFNLIFLLQICFVIGTSLVLCRANKTVLSDSILSELLNADPSLFFCSRTLPHRVMVTYDCVVIKIRVGPIIPGALL